MSPSSLRTDLLASFALLTVAALVLAVGTVVLLQDLLGPARATLYLATVIMVDVAVFVAFGAYLIEKLIVAPLDAAVAAANAIASGDLRRRVPVEGPLEIRQLARTFNHMTDRLLEERAQLVRVEKLASIGRLAAGVAHEIGNPLGAISGYAHVLRRHAGQAPDVAEAVKGLERETGRIDHIVRGLLDYSRPRSATPTLLDVNRLVNGVVDLLRAQGALRRVDVRLELDGFVPCVRGQRNELEQVLVNLILNAIDAMDGAGRLSIHTERVARAELLEPTVRRGLEGTPIAVEHRPPARAELWLSNTQAGEIAKLLVVDSGPGIPDDLLERIFDPFFTTKEPGKGTGLGLAIVARIIDNMGGTVWARRSREGGAALHILLPHAADGVPAAVAAEPKQTVLAQ